MDITMSEISLILVGFAIFAMISGTVDQVRKYRRYEHLMNDPKILDIKRVDINTGDILVIRYQDGFTREQREDLTKAFSEATKGRFLLMMLNKDLFIEAVLAYGSPKVTFGPDTDDKTKGDSPEPFPLSQVERDDGSDK